MLANTVMRTPLTSPTIHNINVPTNQADGYRQQYSQLYFCRLQVLQEPLLRAVQKNWRDTFEFDLVSRILDLSITGGGGRESVIFGTIFVECPGKPNVLETLESDLSLPRLYELPSSYLVEGKMPHYYLEDDSGRIELVFDEASFHLKNEMVTGMCIAVRGRTTNGSFTVNQILLPGMAPPITSPNLVKKPTQILLTSGLGIGGNEGTATLELLVESIKGNLNTGILDNVQALFIIGDCIKPSLGIAENIKVKYGNEGSKYKLDDINQLDRFLKDISQSIPIAIIPGLSDPVNLALPQAPLGRVFLPNTLLNSPDALFLGSNPSWWEANGHNLLLISGAPMEDALRYVDQGEDGIERRLKMAKLLLEARHMIPTAPDTLWCYPFYERDPFVLDKSPEFLLVGNQPNYGSVSLCHENTKSCTTIILVPSFTATSSVVLLEIDGDVGWQERLFEIDIITFKGDHDLAIRVASAI